MDPNKTEVYDDDVLPRRPSPIPWVVAGLAVLAGGAGAVMLWSRLAVAEGETARAKAALELVSSEQAQLSQRLEKIEAEKSDLLALRNELSVQVAAKQEELQKLQGTYQELESKMKEEIAKGDIRLSQTGGRIKVDLVDKILFDVGDASVTERGAGVLSRVGAILANVEDKKIQVSGHTDDQPISERLRDRYPTNWELAAARASNVVRFLEEKANVPGRRLVAAAYGPWEPISSNRGATGRARNRRIEIVLTPQLAPAPIDGAKVASSKEPAAAAKAPVKTAAVATKKASAKPAAKKRKP
ncbi:MAG TPA: flagellar motor protein MotB [Anaeromyxobacter sp.]